MSSEFDRILQEAEQEKAQAPAQGSEFDRVLSEAQAEKAQPSTEAGAPAAQKGPGIAEKLSGSTFSTFRGLWKSVPGVGEQIVQGMDAATAMLNTLFSGKSYEAERAAVELSRNELSQQYGIAETAGRVTGTVAQFVALGKAVPEAVGLAGKTLGARALAAGKTSGALAAADVIGKNVAEGREDPLEGALFAGLISGGLGALTPVVAERIIGPAWQAMVNPEEFKVGLSAALEAEKKGLYKAVTDAGVRVRGKAVEHLVQNIEAEFKAASNFRPREMSVLTKALETAKDAIANPKFAYTLDEIDGGIRRAFMAARFTKTGVAQTDREVADFAYKAMNHIDDFVASLKTNNLLLASNAPAKGVVELLEKARQVNARQQSTLVIENMFARAINNKQGFGQGLYQEFKNLAGNPRRMARFSPAEQEAIRAFASSKTPNRLLDFISSYDPTGMYRTWLSGAAGFAAGNVGGAAAAVGTSSLVGATGKFIANAQDVRAAARVYEGIAKGSLPQTGGLIQRTPTLGEIVSRSGGLAASFGTAKTLDDLRRTR